MLDPEITTDIASIVHYPAILCVVLGEHVPHSNGQIMADINTKNKDQEKFQERNLFM